MKDSGSQPHPPPEREWTLAGPAGDLEARLRPVPPGRPLRAAALLCHPHPAFGGTMMNKVLYRIAKRLPSELGVAALRFNFRGVGESEGETSGGRGEIEDARAALASLGEHYESGPLLGVGYSFGAAFGLRGMLDHPRLAALVALGLPLLEPFRHPALLRSELPLLVVQGERDEFGSGEELLAYLAERAGPTRIELVDGATHLFPGQEDAAVGAVVAYLGAFLDRTLPPSEIDP